MSEKLEEVRWRFEHVEDWLRAIVSPLLLEDVQWLISEVERLRDDLDNTIKQEFEKRKCFVAENKRLRAQLHDLKEDFKALEGAGRNE